MNGNDADRHEYPWQVGLKEAGSETFCGGTIIAPCHVLTAAHCVVHFGPEDALQVALGDHDHTSVDGTEVIRTVLPMTSFVVTEAKQSLSDRKSLPSRKSTFIPNGTLMPRAMTLPSLRSTASPFRRGRDRPACRRTTKRNTSGTRGRPLGGEALGTTVHGQIYCRRLPSVS